MDIQVRNLFIRAYYWVDGCLSPVFRSLVTDLEVRGYEASFSKPTKESMFVVFSKGYNRFEYTLTCCIRPPKPEKSEGHIELSCSSVIPGTRFSGCSFRSTRRDYDVDDTSEKEIRRHLNLVFDFWFIIEDKPKKEGKGD